MKTEYYNTNAKLNEDYVELKMKNKGFYFIF